MQLAMLLQQQGPPTSLDWHAHREVFQTWELLRGLQNFMCGYTSRELNAEAHELANLGRKEKFEYEGFTLPKFRPMIL